MSVCVCMYIYVIIYLFIYLFIHKCICIYRRYEQLAYATPHRNCVAHPIAGDIIK